MILEVISEKQFPKTTQATGNQAFMEGIRRITVWTKQRKNPKFLKMSSFWVPISELKGLEMKTKALKTAKEVFVVVVLSRLSGLPLPGEKKKSPLASQPRRNLLG